MINRMTHFDVNDSFGKRAEDAVRSMLSRHLCVAEKEREWDADVTAKGTVYGDITFGVECIRKWTARQFPYENYNLLTHKRARKMLNGQERFLFVVSADCERFMFYTPSCVPEDAEAWSPGGRIPASDGSSFARGSDNDPLQLASCPWGYSGEWAFKVPAKPSNEFSGVDTIPLDIIMRKISWSGPPPLSA